MLTQNFVSKLKKAQEGGNVFASHFKPTTTKEDIGDSFQGNKDYVKYRSRSSRGVIFFRVQNQIPIVSRKDQMEECRSGFWKVLAYKYNEESRTMKEMKSIKIYAKLPSPSPCIIYRAFGFLVSKENEQANYRRKHKKKLENSKGYINVQNVSNVYSSLFRRFDILKSLVLELGMDEQSTERILQAAPADGIPLLQWCREQRWWKEYMDRSHYGLYSRLCPLFGVLEEKCAEKKIFLCILKKYPSDLVSFVRAYERDPGILCRSTFKNKHQLPDILPPNLVEKVADAVISFARVNFVECADKRIDILEENMKNNKCATDMNERIVRIRQNSGSTAIKIESSFRDDPGFRIMLKEGSLVKCSMSDRYVMLCDDWNDINRLVDSLNKVKKNFDASLPPYLQQRGNLLKGKIESPCKNGQELCDEQKDAMRHVHKNWITVITGTPGSGKTECITYLMMRYQRVLVMSRDNIMVSNLKKRIGDDSVHTVDSLVYRKRDSTQRCREVSKKLGQYEIVVIDECSNLSTNSMGRALSVAGNAKRIVLLGDQNQIDPIDPGAPFHQIISALPECVFRLKVCHRVGEESKDLVSAYKRVLQGHMFGCFEYKEDVEEEDVLLYVKVSDGQVYQDLLPKVFETNREFKTEGGSTQILALNRETVARLNMMMFKVLHSAEEYQEAIVRFRNKRPILVSKGMRVCFRSTTRKSAKTETGFCSSDVSNGEIATIERVEDISNTLGSSVFLESGCVPADHLDKSQSRVLHLSSGKSVILCKKRGFDPAFLDYGWAATVDSMQGGEADTVMFVHAGEEVRGNNWSRAHMYVAVSRARKRLWMVGDIDDLENLAQTSPIIRKSDLAYRIKNDKELTNLGQKYTHEDEDCYVSIAEFVTQEEEKERTRMEEEEKDAIIDDLFGSVFDDEDDDDSQKRKREDTDAEEESKEKKKKKNEEDDGKGGDE